MNKRSSVEDDVGNMSYSAMAALASDDFSYYMKEYVTLFSFFLRMSDLITPN
jgi:hypothetical protein